MKMATIAQMVEQFVSSMDGRPMFEVMRADEEAAGGTIILPGEVSWLPSDEWDETITVSQRGKEIRLIAILAKTPNAGAFRRTVAGILNAGLVPVIVCPTSRMRNTMQRWNWFQRHVGSGWNHEEQWRPRKGWRPVPVTEPRKAEVA